jgi:hypothetical protein
MIVRFALCPQPVFRNMIPLLFHIILLSRVQHRFGLVKHCRGQLSHPHTGIPNFDDDIKDGLVDLPGRAA